MYPTLWKALKSKMKFLERKCAVGSTKSCPLCGFDRKLEMGESDQKEKATNKQTNTQQQFQSTAKGEWITAPSGWRERVALDKLDNTEKLFWFYNDRVEWYKMKKSLSNNVLHKLFSNLHMGERTKKKNVGRFDFKRGNRHPAGPGLMTNVTAPWCR